jgi:hypothetical protein
MDSILVNPKDEKELQLLSELFSKMKIQSKILTNEEKEDIIFADMMRDVDRNEKVSREEVMGKLSK